MAEWAQAHFSQHKEPRSGTSPGFVLLLSVSNLIKRKTFPYGSGTNLGGSQACAGLDFRPPGRGRRGGAQPLRTSLLRLPAALLLVSRRPGRRALPRARLPVRSRRGGFWVPAGVGAAARRQPWAPAARAHLTPRSPRRGRGAGLSPSPRATGAELRARIPAPLLRPPVTGPQSPNGA